MPLASSLPAVLGACEKSLASQFLTQFLGIHGQRQAHGDGANRDFGMLGAVGCVELDGHALRCERRGQGEAADPCEVSPPLTPDTLPGKWIRRVSPAQRGAWWRR